MQYVVPAPLKKGDTLGVCAPSGAFDPDQFKRGVKKIESMGFHLHIPMEIYEHKRYMAGEDATRVKIIHDLFAAPFIKGILCARGGFGALRLLKNIDFNLIAKNPKSFVGFSDVTALLSAISQRTSLQVIHGPVVTSLADASEETIRSLYEQLTLTSHFPSQKIFRLYAPCALPLRKGVATGRLTGGNLATLCHLIGTPFQPDFNNVILFLEDVGEAPYKIDRMLSQMKLAGVLNGVRGVVTGSFERCGEETLIHEILLDIFDSPDIPVMSGIAAGHGKVNISMRFSDNVMMDTETKTLVWLNLE